MFPLFETIDKDIDEAIDEAKLGSDDTPDGSDADAFNNTEGLEFDDTEFDDTERNCSIESSDFSDTEPDLYNSATQPTTRLGAPPLSLTEDDLIEVKPIFVNQL